MCPSVKQERASLERAGSVYGLLLEELEKLGVDDPVNALARVLNSKEARTSVAKAADDGQVDLDGSTGDGAFVCSPIGQMDRGPLVSWLHRHGLRPATELEVRQFVCTDNRPAMFSLNINWGSYSSFDIEGVLETRGVGGPAVNGHTLEKVPPLKAKDKFLAFSGTNSNILRHISSADFSGSNMGFVGLKPGVAEIEFCQAEEIIRAMGWRIGQDCVFQANLWEQGIHQHTKIVTEDDQDRSKARFKNGWEDEGKAVHVGDEAVMLNPVHHLFVVKAS